MIKEEIEEEEEEEENVKKISISLPSSLVEKVEDYAEEKKLKRSQVVRKAVERFFEEGEPDLWENEVSEKLDRIEDTQKAILKKIEKPAKPAKPVEESEEEKEEEVDEWDETLDWESKEEPKEEEAEESEEW